MSDNDLPLHLHFALFNGSGGFVLKPPEMLPADPKDPSESDSKEPSATAGRASQASVAKSDMEDDSFKGQTSANREEDYEPAEFDDYWPPVRERIHCITIRVISLHSTPFGIEPKTAL
eukprot:5287588-Prymnesium_polylepis.2